MTFEEALKDEYCKKVMGLLGKWLPRLEKSELKQLQLIALWEAVSTYDSCKSKFTTHLYNRIRFKYLKYINNKQNKTTKKKLYHDKYEKPEFNELLFFDGISEENKQLLKDRFVSKLSLNQMVKKYNLKRFQIIEKLELAKLELKAKHET